MYLFSVILVEVAVFSFVLCQKLLLSNHNPSVSDIS